MKNKLLIYFKITLCLVILVLLTFSTIEAKEAPRITKEELKVLISYTDVIILDVRTGKDWKASEFKIKGATREDPKNFKSWTSRYPQDKTIILYCA
jgi:hypothetical protein